MRIYYTKLALLIQLSIKIKTPFSGKNDAMEKPTKEIRYGTHSLNQDDVDAVIAVLKSDWLTSGPITPVFEQSISSFVGAEFGVAVNNATSALIIAYAALGFGAGDVLWTSPNTFVSTANAAIACGGKVDFVDIDPDSYNLSVEKLSEKLEIADLEGKLPKIVVPVHFAGQSCEMLKIFELSKKYGFHIVEDASHALGATYLGKSVGNCRYSDICVFSFHPVKMITSGEGGLATTNNADLYEKMKLIRSHGISSNESCFYPRPDEEIWNYQQFIFGYNFRLTDFQAALGLSQLNRLPNFVRRRVQIAREYDEKLSRLPIVTPWQSRSGASSYHLYPICLQKSYKSTSQKFVYQKLVMNGIQANLHYIPVYRQPYYEKLGFKKGYCREAESYFKRSVSLPIHFELSSAQQDYIIKTLEQVV